MTSRPLTARTFDRLVVAPPPPAPTVLWGAKAIAAAINSNEDFVRDVLAKEEGTPIKKVGSRYCVIESDLFAFIRR